MRIRWANVAIFVATVAGTVWAVSHRRTLSEVPERLGRLFEINPEWEPVFVLLGGAVVLALVVRIVRDSNTRGGA